MFLLGNAGCVEEITLSKTKLISDLRNAMIKVKQLAWGYALFHKRHVADISDNRGYSG
jgi:hypothetical protein